MKFQFTLLMTALVLASGAKAESFQEPKRDYGFNYQIKLAELDGQQVKEIQLHDKRDSELIDQIFVVRYRDPKTNAEVKVRTYAEADKICSGLRSAEPFAKLEYLDSKFEVPYDYLMFFMIDEDLISVGRPAGAGENSTATMKMIYPFWTQGALNPGSMSLFKIDSTAGYVVNKSYDVGFIFNFPSPEALQETEKNLAQKIQGIEKKLASVQKLISGEGDLEDYVRAAHLSQIEKLREHALELKRELAVSRIQKEGLEVHCVAGARLDPSHFTKPLSGSSSAAGFANSSEVQRLVGETVQD